MNQIYVIKNIFFLLIILKINKNRSIDRLIHPSITILFNYLKEQKIE